MAGELDFFAAQETIDSVFETYFEKFQTETDGTLDYSVDDEWNEADIDVRFYGLWDPKDEMETSVVISVTGASFSISMFGDSDGAPYFRCSGDRKELTKWLGTWRLSHL